MKPFEYPLKVGDRTYRLAYTFKVRRAFETKHKRSVSSLLNALGDPEQQTAEELIQLFSMFLSTHHPELAEDDIAELIDRMGGEDVAMREIGKALGITAGEGDLDPTTRAPTS